MRNIFTCLVFIGCGQKQPPPCQEWTLEEAIGPVIELSRPGGPNIDLQAVIPTQARTTLGAPTAVFVHGGWNPVQIPLENDSVTLRSDLGFTSLYPNLGRTDIRGATSRAIVARVLEYANGDITDTDGCSLHERIPDGRGEEVVLAGFSNGGNLAWATAGDATLNIPRLDGIATFETPISSQLILVETGTKARSNPRFDVDLCTLETDSTLQCGIDYSPLLASSSDECEPHSNCLFIDIDESNGRSEGDFQLGALTLPETDSIVFSTAATIAAEALHILPENAYRKEETDDFWSVREATRAIGQAALQFPDLAGISTGTETDHVLDDLPRAIHVLGMAQAMKENGISWSRLHPDSKFLDEIHGEHAAWADISANSEIGINETEWGMEPEDDATVRGTDYLSAAVIEIIDRSRAGDWSNNL